MLASVTGSVEITVHPDGTDLTPVTARGSEKPWIATPAWTPDGRRILVTLIHGPDEHKLATIERHGNGLAEIVDPDTREAVLGAHARQTREETQ